MTTKNETKGLFVKLAEVQQAIKDVPKRGRNPHLSYSYVQAVDVKEALREELAKRNIVIVPEIVEGHHEPITTRDGKPSIMSVLTVRFHLIDGDTGEEYTALWQTMAFDTQDKGVPKAMTMATKYFLINLFLVPGDEEDPDGDPEQPVNVPRPVHSATPTKGNGQPQRASQGTTGDWTMESVRKLVAYVRESIWTSMSEEEAIENLGVLLAKDYPLRKNTLDELQRVLNLSGLKRTQANQILQAYQPA